MTVSGHQLSAVDMLAPREIAVLAQDNAPNRPLGRDALLGTVVSGSYEIERLVGEGGMGKVYVAKHQRLPRKAAVKVLQPELASDQSMFERFKREAEVASGLGSRHIVHVFDFGFIGQSPFMLME